MRARSLLLVVTSILACRSSEPEAEVKPLVTVKVARAVLSDVDLEISAPAVVAARERANITSSITAPLRLLRARKGDKVARGQVLAVLEDRDLVAQRGEATAAVRQAEVLRRRRAELYEQGAIPHRELLATETDLAQSRARLERVEAQLRFAELRSPFAGSIVEQFLYPGDMVKPDTPVFTVVDMSVAVARAQVPESDVSAVRVGQRATFRSEDTSATAFEGKVTMVNQAVDPARRTVEVWGELANADGGLRDGVFGHLRILTGTRPRRVVVPRAAVVLSADGASGTVMVVDAKRTAHKQEIAVGGAVGAPNDRVVVAKGLSAGDTVIVEGGYALPDGTAVRLEGDAGP
jgi:multidrug efflux system membrane fusion protein